jgi:very-short-patch-repair endonuclease
MALIENEIKKEQGFIPIRNLIKRAGYSLLQLTPSFMMSPLSLAKFLPALNTEFDLTIIDEASQMKPEDALGGVLRSKQIVVVGDPKQLPPTDFFNRADSSTKGLNEDEEEFEDIDDESILEACQKSFQKVRRLKWHYRSRCESLITFNGYTVDYQVGVSGFRIDLGVRHPEKPEMFLAGIECDGAQYHSNKSARDRDRLREEILNGLGWTIVRVWSTDWFENADEETRKLILKLEALKIKKPRADVSEQYQFVTKFESGASVDMADLATTADAVPIDVSGRIEIPRATREIETASSAESNGIVFPITASNARLSPGQAQRELRQFRESVIAKEMDDWEPERSILREGMIETFVSTRLSDPYDWFRRIPQYQRQNTNPIEKQKYLETICEIVSRIDS